VLDSTDAFARCLHSESHIAGFTPAFSPGILHDPEVLSVLRSVSNDKGSVIKVGTTASAVKDSACVLLEDGFVSFNGNRNWLFGNGCLHLLNIVCCHHFVVSNVDTRNVCGFVGASSIFTSVRVFGFGFDFIVLQVVECILLKSTVAAVVSVACCLCSAIDELLLRE